jgi:hypothetical protein
MALKADLTKREVTPGGPPPFQLYTLWSRKLDILEFHFLEKFPQ